ncbi:MAG: transporter [Bacteroidales bacterium]
MRAKIKNLMLPLSIIGGILFHEWIGEFQGVVPFLIFASLVISFCKVKPHEVRIKDVHIALISFQLLASWVVYLLLLPINPIVAQGAFLCLLMPTASAAPVFTGMVGGSVSFVLAYSLLCNSIFAVLSPFFLNIITANDDIGFFSATITIGERIFPMIAVPLLIAFSLRYFAPKVHTKLVNNQVLSFYLWAVALFISVGNAVSFVIKHGSEDVWSIVGLAIISLVVCVLQFMVGKRIGASDNNSIAAGQALGQKNTILAIWVALTFMNPICSVAPASYILWQNSINSYELFRKNKSKS